MKTGNQKRYLNKNSYLEFDDEQISFQQHK
ncbi:hypothetical protein Bhyg_01656 [Pseudolycoriella hygida]|uniref:Uncharacterized protein n=1 Tax=Pseudolycoriella hygida TaxID=35572 RepID=A0A9Q0S7M2_9DIPT|nr:hypothetical protein Bhyg_01656 [Pseudolycoriella hygida]